MAADAVDVYLVEYQECMESYRHTYATIWQAGAVFTAISAGILAFGTGGEGGDVAPLIQIVAPIPFLFWFLGVFRPMNRYGEWRSDRLEELEEILSDKVKDLDMRHYRRFGRRRKGESRLRRLVTLRWLWRPRVSEVVSLMGMSLLVVEVVLISVNYL